MADTKITALAAIATVDPAADVLPIVDISDTSMAASGTTKKVTSNQILGAGGTATLASATISGDLTVDTSTLKVDSANNRVGIGTASPAAGYALDVRGNIAGGNGTIFGGITYSTRASVGAFSNHDLDLITNGQPVYIVTTAGVHTWINASTTAMTLNSTGLGIGGSPSYKLQVTDTSVAAATALARFVGQSNYNLDIQSVNNSVGTVGNRFNFNIGSGGGEFSFSNSGGTRMYIDQSGNVGIGVTPSTSRLLLKGDGTNIPVKIVGTAGDTTIPHLVIDKKDNNTTTSQLFIQFVVADNGAGSGQINANGVNQAAFGTYSDSRLKKNIVSLPSQLANILSLRPVEFDYKDGNGHQIGFIAQEMQEVYADAVGEQEGFLTVSGWNKTEARLVSAIKELAAKVQALEAKLA